MSVGPGGEAPPIQCVGTVVFNRSIGQDTLLIRIEQPELAAAILPGQFVMLRVPGRTDPLLARPFALYDTGDDQNGKPATLDFVYLVLGGGTRCLSALAPGAGVVLWGPLGNTFAVDWPAGPPEHLMIVAGGIGQTPFVAVIKELLGLRRYGPGREAPRPKRITFVWGARTAGYLAGLDDFRQPGVTVEVATDDGTAGRRGFVTDLVETALASADPPTALFACGPFPMLGTLAGIAERASVPCWVSLEQKMACGYGVCFSCVCPVRHNDEWDYRRVCIEGPIYRADRIAWNA